MVKCVVSACPNRLLGVQRGLVQRPAKRFFSFPEDPARVQVWLAALRESGGRDTTTEQQLICEDHFLPEDVSSGGVGADAIPIMPPCLDGPPGMMGTWGAESSEEEEGDDDEAVDEEGDGPPPPAVNPPQQEKTSEAEKTSVVLRRSRRADKQDSCLAALMERFLELLLAAPGGSLHLGQAVTRLRTCRRRVDDVAGILRSVQLLEEQPGDRVKWIGERPIGSFLWRNRQKLRRNLENLKVMEDTLDSLIKSCSEQLFVMTDDRQNSTSAYVTHDDLGRLRCFQGQTAIVVKAPEETALSVPAPTEDRIQVHLKGAGPILVLTCDIGSEHFITLEDSWIKTTTLHTGKKNESSRS
ncbi:transcription factor E2F6-like isoform X1 [Scophthalmus maximus]|uniref:THAP-type domain-containing protein n=1 Tax=Scophthalmus maximus TaxID=52904 RepID=A0A8D3DLE0_SCOMX|nr:transcription factor E2F6-like isoform X1 [Scophthalmus maximus]